MIDFIKSWVLCMALTVVGVMIFSDCGKDQTNNNEYKIGYLLTLDHPYWQNMRLGAVDEGKKLGAKEMSHPQGRRRTYLISRIAYPFSRAHWRMIAHATSVVCFIHDA